MHALTYADPGDGLAAQARADEAITTWNRALDLADDLASRRTRAAIHAVRAQLATYRRRAAVELDRRARDALT